MKMSWTHHLTAMKMSRTCGEFEKRQMNKEMSDWIRNQEIRKRTGVEDVLEFITTEMKMHRTFCEIEERQMNKEMSEWIR